MKKYLYIVKHTGNEKDAPIAVTLCTDHLSQCMLDTLPLDDDSAISINPVDDKTKCDVRECTN